MDEKEKEDLLKEVEEKKLPDSYRVRPQLLKMHKINTKRWCEPDQLLEQLTELGGNVTLVANHYGVARSTILNWLEKDGNTHMLKEIDEAWNDIAETQLNNSILAGKPWAIQLRLKTKAKDRGYYELQEHNVNTKIRVKLEGEEEW